MTRNVLVIDVGGSHIKVESSARRTRTRVDSGPDLTPRQMVDRVLAVTGGWQYDVVSIGYPGPVVRGRITREPHNLGRGWTRFDFERAFGCPVRLINDAAMQAIGSYRGKRMLFLGLGTGLGTTLIRDNIVIPLEIAHLPYEDGATYEEVVGDAGRKRIGVRRWRRHVANIVALMMNAVVADYTVLGGGNVRLLPELPPRTRRGANANAFRGGVRLWHPDFTLT
jgi:polyphosphate glucokinase